MRPQDARSEIRRLNKIIQAQQAKIADLEVKRPATSDIGMSHVHTEKKKTDLEHHKVKP